MEFRNEKKELQKVKLPKGVSRLQFIISRHYNYLTFGMSFTNLLKYAIVFFGLGEAMATGKAMFGIIALVGYAIFCYLFGMYIYKSGFIFALHEVSNQYDSFEREMRELKEELRLTRKSAKL